MDLVFCLGILSVIHFAIEIIWHIRETNIKRLNIKIKIIRFLQNQKSRRGVSFEVICRHLQDEYGYDAKRFSHKVKQAILKLEKKGKIEYVSSDGEFGRIRAKMYILK